MKKEVIPGCGHLIDDKVLYARANLDRKKALAELERVTGRKLKIVGSFDAKDGVALLLEEQKRATGR